MKTEQHTVTKRITGLLPGRTARWAFLPTLLTVVAVSARADNWNLLVAFGDGVASIMQYDGRTKAYLGPFVPSGSGSMGHPQAMTFGPDGNLYVATCHSEDGTIGRVKCYDGQTGAFMPGHLFQSMSSGAEPFSPTFGPDGNLYVSEWTSGNILRYNPTTGSLIDVFIPAGRGGLVNPVGFLFAPGDNFYVSSGFRPAGDSGTNRVLRFSATTGAFKDTFIAEGSGGLRGPTGLTFGPDGNLYVAGYYSGNVLRYDGTNGAFIDAFVPTKPANQPGALSEPGPLKFGPDGHLYVGCFGTRRIQRYDGLTGAFLDAFAGSAGRPFDIAFFTPAPPQLAVAAALTNGQFSLRLRGTPGIKYVIQTSTDLAQTNWSALVTNAPAPGTGIFSFTDTHATNGSGFYRAVKQ